MMIIIIMMLMMMMMMMMMKNNKNKNKKMKMKMLMMMRMMRMISLKENKSNNGSATDPKAPTCWDIPTRFEQHMEGSKPAQIGPSLVQLLHSHSAIGMPGIFLEPKWLDPIEILEM